MAGGIVIAVILVLMPVVICMTMAVIAAILGALLNDDVDKAYADTEYLELGR